LQKRRLNLFSKLGEDMDAVATTQTVIVAVIGGVLIKVLWDWVTSGRVKKGEYYMTVVGCESIRAACGIHAISDALARQKNTMIREDSEIKGRLTAIEDRMKEAKEEARSLKQEVSGIRSAVDRMAGAIESYAADRKRSDPGGQQ
jgi:hypothetical protein